MDDVFDEDQDESVIASTEWRRLQSNRNKDGFRDGVEKSRDAKLQEGFDDGYRQSAELSERLGKLRGMLSSVLVLHMKPTNEFDAGSDERITSIEELLSRVSEFENNLPTRLKLNAEEKRTPNTSTCIDGNVDTYDDSALNECSASELGMVDSHVSQFENLVDSLLRELALVS